ncbi:MAG: glycoside hydrolase family 97 protein [Kiritimatiellae bacterium]|nr:glycoside hydrolase family 97 protein [Kiritimatiellia bacterium]
MRGGMWWIAVGALATAAGEWTLQSPDGALRATLRSPGGRAPVEYHLAWRGRPVLAASPLRFDVDIVPTNETWQVLGVRERATNAIWRPVAGERSMVRDVHREVELDLAGERSGVQLRWTFRAYDEGLAFRYAIHAAAERARLIAEFSEFHFAADGHAWAAPAAQAAYERVPLSSLRAGTERPLVVELEAGGIPLFVALGEAALVDWPRMKFAPVPGSQRAVVSRLDGPAEGPSPLKSPWRFVMVADSPGALLEHNDLVLNLNEPCALADTSWIRPGKVIREVTLTTEGGRACVDFAVKRGLQFIEYDAGWYGHEYDDQADATTVTVDPKRSKGPLDLPAVIRYATERGIGVILYVNRRALERQLDVLLPLYRDWGVAGVKFGFVNVGPQHWTSWLHEAIRRAAAHRLMVDVHDEYRETGVRRTWPNLMTVEGVRGDEESPPTRQTLITAFTRALAGPADHTVCYYSERVPRLWGHAHQLAKPVVIFSPWQFLFWYDRPAQSRDEPELEFWNHMPTVWDDTRVLAARIGEFAVIARRSGEQWFIGAMNAETPRTLNIRLPFLDPNRFYEAVLYRDDASVPTATKVRVERRRVDATSELVLALGADRGAAIRLVPAAPARDNPAPSATEGSVR